MRKLCTSSGSSNVGTVDKYIDTAYDTVKLVADNLGAINTVADNIEGLQTFLGTYESDPASRPNGDPLQEGDLYFNSLTNILHVYSGGVWTGVTSTGSTFIDQFTGDGVTTDFVLSTIPGDETKTSVYIQGVYQQKDAYSIINGNTISFTEAPFDGNTIEVNSYTLVSFAAGVSQEEITLTSGQTYISFINPVHLAAFHLSGQDVDARRLIATIDYTFDVLTNSITLTDSFPAGSKITMLYADELTQANGDSGFISRQSFTGNGSTDTYYLTVTPAVGGANTIVSIDGVTQPISAYTTSGKALTFTEAPPYLSNIEVMTISVGAPLPSDIAAQSQTVTLTAGQTVVTFANSIDRSAFFVSGPDADNGRLILNTDYTANISTKTITLTESYPAGTKILHVYYDSSSSLANVIAGASMDRHTFSGDDSTVTFTVTGTPITTGSVIVLIGGLVQEGSSYTVSGANITFSEAPPAGTNNIEVLTLETAPIGYIDAANATYLPAGAGAVQTDVQTKLREIVSVLDFGADPSGLTDSTVAIQAALNVQGTVYIPSGTYLVTSSLIVKSDTKVIGDGYGSTIIQEGGNAANFTISLLINENYNSSTGNDSIHIEGINFKGKNSTPITDGSVTASIIGIGGVYLGFCTNSKISQCYAQDGWTGFNMAGDRAGFSDTINNSVEDCVAFNCQSYAENGNSGTPRGFLITTQKTKLYRCVAKTCSTGFFIGAFEAALHDCVAANWTYDDGFYLVSPNVAVVGCHAEGTDFGNGFAIAYNYGAKLINCKASGCSNMAYRLHAPQRKTVISNCEAVNCGYGIRSENTITFTPSSVTASAGVVTVDLGIDVAANTLFAVGAYCKITGINEAGYNGVWKIESVAGNTFTYKSSAAVTSPATGTIVAAYAVSDIKINNVTITDVDNDAIELLYSANVSVNNATIDNVPAGYGVEIGYSKDITVSNSMFYDVFRQIAYPYNSENVHLTNLTSFNCKTVANTASNNGVIIFFEVDGIFISGITGSTAATYFIFQSSTETTPSVGFVRDCKRTDGTADFYQTFAGVYFEGYGTGSPEGNGKVAGIGSVWHRYDGGASTSLYIKESGTSDTGWVAK